MVNQLLNSPDVPQPSSEGELSAIIADSAKRGRSLAPRGSGTSLHWLPAMEARSRPLVSLGLQQIVEYTPADLTITAQAGCPIRVVQEALAANGQFLPLDYARGTVGGAIATGAAGVLTLGYGALRDRLLRVRAVTAEGQITTAGSKVVKSVAGYDLAKLYCGSFGTLVFIVEATFKVAPLPQRSIALSFTGPPGSVRTWTHQLLSSPFRPAALSVLNSPAAATLATEELAGGDFLAIVRISGRVRAVERQVAELTARATSAALRAGEPVDADVPDRLASLADQGTEAAILKLQSSDLFEALARATESGVPAMAELGANRLLLRANAGTLVALLDALWRGMECPGMSSVHRRQNGAVCRQRLGAGSKELTGRIKRALDPDDIFNRGLLPKLLGS